VLFTKESLLNTFALKELNKVEVLLALIGVQMLSKSYYFLLYFLKSILVVSSTILLRLYNELRFFLFDVVNDYLSKL